MLEHLWMQFRKAAHLTSSPKHLSRTTARFISVPGSGFSHGRSQQGSREDDPGNHIERRQLHRMLPSSVCHLQQAWQLH